MLALGALVFADAGEAGSVAAEVDVAPTQAQAGKSIRILAAITAHDYISATGRGTVKVGGESRRLWPKGGLQNLRPDGFYALNLRPTLAVRKQIARALTNGQILHAEFTVILTNRAGVVQKTHHRVRLTKFRR
jgi:hypothetical protein